MIKVIIIGIAAGLCNGLFGSGGGIILVPAMINLLGVEGHDAHATAIAIILPLSLISIMVYFNNDFFNLDMTWKVGMGGIAGAGVGAWALNRISVKMLSKIFAIFMILAGLRMVF